MSQNNDYLLQCRNLTLERDSFTLKNIQFDLPSGYILGVMGRNGVGKSTLVYALLGEYKRGEQNRVVLKGMTMGEDIAAYKKSLAFVLNETPFPQKINALDCARLYACYYEKFDRSKYRSLLREFGVPEKIPIKKLSTGQKIRQQLAFALSYDARLYIFDEPAGNLDPGVRELFWERTKELIREGDRSVIYVSHLVDELERMADYILWIGAGKKEEKIKEGVQKYFGETEELMGQFQLIQASRDEAWELPAEAVAFIRDRENAKELLVRISRENLPEWLKKVSRRPTLKEIIYYVETGGFTNLDGE
ncbi:MAG: ABC transporter ATP-binding protein [Roseburia sp.]|nr:ABC transporter ATP-binding protein [Roseburia sp.]